MTPAPLAAALEVALDRALALEPSLKPRLVRFEGRRIGLELAPFGWQFVIEGLPGGRFRVGADERDPAPDAVLAAGLTDLLARAADVARGAPFSARGLKLQGDAELLQDFAGTLSAVGFDLAEWLAPVLGDAMAHRAAGFLRDLVGFGRRSSRLIAENAAEYLVEETGDLARKADVEAWMDAVDALRDRLEHFEARLTRLERRWAH